MLRGVIIIRYQPLAGLCISLHLVVYIFQPHCIFADVNAKSCVAPVEADSCILSSDAPVLGRNRYVPSTPQIVRKQSPGEPVNVNFFLQVSQTK